MWEDANDPVYVGVSEFARALGNLKIHPFRTIVLRFTLIDRPISGTIKSEEGREKVVIFF